MAFGSDSLVELLSATVVLLQWIPGMSISERRASRIAGALLFVLAFVVATIAPPLVSAEQLAAEAAAAAAAAAAKGGKGGKGAPKKK